MNTHSTDCIYFKCGPNKCCKFGNRGQKCKSKGCKDIIKDKTGRPVFDDTKWAWKTGMNMLTRMYHNLVREEQRILHSDTRHTKASYKRGHYQFIAREAESLVKIMVLLRKHFGSVKNKVKFLDCGCGIGNVVALATYAGFDAHGVEFSSKNLAAGKKFLKRLDVDPARIHKGDLLNYPYFDEYDVLYGYCPMCDHKKEKMFEHKLFQEMKIGAIVVGLHAHTRVRIGSRERVYFQRLMLDRPEYSVANGYIKVAHEKR